MKKLLLIASLSSCFLSAAPINWAEADLSSVTSVGQMDGAALSTLFDGVLLADGTAPKPHDGVWWNQQPTIVDGSPSPAIFFNLNAPHLIDRVVIQADRTDTYRLDYLSDSVWQTLYTTLPTATGSGVKTYDQIIAPIVASSFRFYAPVGGDKPYGVSEIQLWGDAGASQASTVPEPSTWAMLAGGSALLLLRRRKAR
jgi:hypothetical protein